MSASPLSTGSALVIDWPAGLANEAERRFDLGPHAARRQALHDLVVLPGSERVERAPVISPEAFVDRGNLGEDHEPLGPDPMARSAEA